MVFFVTPFFFFDDFALEHLDELGVISSIISILLFYLGFIQSIPGTLSYYKNP